MTPHHHPSEDLLLDHAAGQLDAGPALIVAIHIETCAGCLTRVRTLEVAGGVLLAELPAAAMSSLALQRALAAIERPAPPLGHNEAKPFKLPDGVVLPDALRGRGLGRWRWLAPDMRWSRVDLADATVVLMRGRAGALLPAHGHRGSEYTQVLRGAILDGDKVYGAGDMFAADDAIQHHLRIAPDADCICIAAIEGQMRMHSLVGRLIQPLVGP